MENKEKFKFLMKILSIHETELTFVVKVNRALVDRAAAASKKT